MEPLQQQNQPPGQAPSDSDLTILDAEAKAKHQRLFERGMKWMGAGAILMAISFGMNFFFFNESTSFMVAMYSVTSLGAIFITIGLVDILGF